MQYVGGKFRIAKALATYLESVRDGRPFIEPFCGGANIIAAVSGTRTASDLCEDVVLLWSAVANGWEPPTHVSESEYLSIKNSPPSALRGFVGFGCSFGGKFFGGYARSGNRNYAMNAHNAIIKKAKSLQGVSFLHRNYSECAPENSLVYCDPPYANTTQGYSSTHFDSSLFWNIMRQWAGKNNIVLVSEYFAPSFAREVWRTETKTDMHCVGGKASRTERLFLVEK
jgi:DNA adenine methylase